MPSHASLSEEGVAPLLAQPTSPSILSPPAHLARVPQDTVQTLWDARAHSITVTSGPTRSSCGVTLTRHERVSGPWCRAEVRCDGTLLRGADLSGYFECEFGAAFPTGYDAEYEDSDSTFSIDASGHFTISDRARAGNPAYSLEGELGPWTAIVAHHELSGGSSDFVDPNVLNWDDARTQTCNYNSTLGQAQFSIARGLVDLPPVIEQSACDLAPATCECLEQEVHWFLARHPGLVGTAQLLIRFERSQTL